MKAGDKYKLTGPGWRRYDLRWRVVRIDFVHPSAGFGWFSTEEDMFYSILVEDYDGDPYRAKRVEND